MVNKKQRDIKSTKRPAALGVVLNINTASEIIRDTIIIPAKIVQVTRFEILTAVSTKIQVF
jgi:hypothetical protein